MKVSVAIEIEDSGGRRTSRSFSSWTVADDLKNGSIRADTALGAALAEGLNSIHAQRCAGMPGYSFPPSYVLSSCFDYLFDIRESSKDESGLKEAAAKYSKLVGDQHDKIYEKYKTILEGE